jgi:hypothetical protein
MISLCTQIEHGEGRLRFFIKYFVKLKIITSQHNHLEITNKNTAYKSLLVKVQRDTL